MPAYGFGDIILNKYRIEKMLGKGAFGEVYLVTHLGLKAPYALKVLRRDQPGVSTPVLEHYQQRFQQEAELGAKIDSPYVVRVYDFEDKQGELFLRMEYVPGGSLEQRLEQSRKMSIADAERLLNDLAQGLAELHKKSIVHRDIKPANILYGAEGTAKIADLGIAQVKHSKETKLTIAVEGSGRNPGTPAYMSPEQAGPYTYLPFASDVYTLGAVVSEALTSYIPRELPPGTRLRSLRPDAPQWLDNLLAAMLEEDCRKRVFNGEKLVEQITEQEKNSFNRYAIPEPPRTAAVPLAWKPSGIYDETRTSDQPVQSNPLPKPPPFAMPIQPAAPSTPQGYPSQFVYFPIKQKPWYRHTAIYVLAFFFFTPLWLGLILSDKDVKRWVKVAVILLLFLGVISICSSSAFR